MGHRKKFFWWGMIGICVLSLFLAFAEGQEQGTSLQKKIKQDKKIAVIRVEGPITGGTEADGIMKATAESTSERLMKEFREAKNEDSVKAVLLRLNSPGGSAPATQEVATEMERFKKTGKPIIVSMGDTAASGAYWLAAKGDYVFANPATMTGSIGVYIGYYNVEELAKHIGIREEKIKSGPHKDMLSPFRNLTKEEEVIMQNMVNDIFDQFVEAVSTGRRMERERVLTLADGRIYTGRQALAVGLVDEMGNYYDALRYTAQKVGLPEENPTIWEMGTEDFGWRRLLKGIPLTQEKGSPLQLLQNEYPFLQLLWRGGQR